MIIILSKQQLQVIILNTTNLQLYDNKYSYLILIILKQIYLILTRTTILGQSWPRCNGNAEVLYTPYIFKTGFMNRELQNLISKKRMKLLTTNKQLVKKNW